MSAELEWKRLGGKTTENKEEFLSPNAHESHNPSAAPSTYYERGFLSVSHPMVLALPNPNALPGDVHFLRLESGRPKWKLLPARSYLSLNLGKST